MILLYNIIIWLLKQLIFFLQFFKPKLRLFWQGRKEIFEKIAHLQHDKRPLAWFHVASLGEFEQARPLLEAFRSEYPTFQILLTFFSPSGYEVRKNYPLADTVCYLPFDTPKTVAKFLNLTNPKIVFFIKYEFWYHVLTQLKERQIPIFSVSAIFNKKHFYFRNTWTKRFYTKIFTSFYQIFVQDQTSADLLKTLHIDSIVTGDTRFDRVRELVDNRKKIEIAQAFCQNKFTLVVGSSWQEDWEVIGDFLNHFQKELKIIIAPHEVSEKNMVWIEKQLSKRKCVRFSQAKPENIGNFDVLLVDNYGMLTSLYQYAHIAYVGGAFGKGLHNVLEPAVYGIAVIFGQNYEKFREVVDLVKLNAVFSVKNSHEFAQKFESLYQNKILRKTIQQISEKYTTQNLGASRKILDFLNASAILKT